MDAYAQIREQAGTNKLSHAWLLLGDGEKPLSELAAFLTRAILCEGAAGKPCGKCPQCRKLQKGIHPDLVVLERLTDKREITVGQVRELRQEVFVLPNEARGKVFLIREADTMNGSAQNALLKVLEEPPSYASFLLLGQNPGAFLPTIRSRCQELRLQGVGKEKSPSQQAAELAEAFIRGDALDFARLSAKLEKLDKERFDRFLTELYQAAGLRARAAAGKPQAAALELCARTAKLMEMRRVYVSPGHCLGWLSTWLAVE